MNSHPRQNQGAALITSLILLMALTMVSLSAMQSTAVQVQISGNDESTMAASQYAQSVIDAVITNGANFVVGTKDGYTVCAVQDAAHPCDQVPATLTSSLSDPMFSGASVGINPTNGVQARVELMKVSTAPRLGASASSASQFNGAYFTITGSYDVSAGTSGKVDGKSTVVQGFVLIVNKT